MGNFIAERTIENKQLSAYVKFMYVKSGMLHRLWHKKIGHLLLKRTTPKHPLSVWTRRARNNNSQLLWPVILTGSTAKRNKKLYTSINVALLSMLESFLK